MQRTVIVLISVVFMGAGLFLGRHWMSMRGLTQDTVMSRTQYERVLQRHPAAESLELRQSEVKEMKKKDRPDLAAAQNFLATMDPILGYPPSERLAPIFRRIKAFKKTAIEGAPGSPTEPWTERGPSNVGGRSRAIMFDPNDNLSRKLWAGGVAGGLWFTLDITNANSAWERVDDFMSNLAITSLTFDPTNTQVFYAGTGEGWFNVDAVRGAGIWKSTDGGNSWDQLPTTANSNFHFVQKVIVDSRNGDVYAATRSGVWRSQDGGATPWTQVRPGWAADLEQASDGTLYATIGILYTDGIYSSSTGAPGSWTKLNTGANGFPTTGFARIEIATAPSSANIIYALAQDLTTDGINGLWRSTNAGTTWNALTLPVDADPDITSDFTRGQAWYDLISAVDPNNSNTVFIGGIDLFKTTNGGTSWTQLSHWYGGFGFPYVHADHHNIQFRPGSSSQIVFSHDGGIDYTSNGTSSTPTFTNRNNYYNVTQFYSCALHPSSGYFLGGTQDNGSQQFTLTGVGPTVEVTGGDGGFTHIDQTNSLIQTTSSTGTSVHRSLNGGVSFTTVFVDTLGSFINPSDYDDNLNILYLARDNTTIRRLGSFDGTLVPGLISGLNLGVMPTHLRVSQYTTTSTTLFVGTGAGRIFKITNANGGAPNTTQITGNLPIGSVSCIEIGANENELLVTFSNYGLTSVWYTSDGGSTWQNREGNLPDMPVRWALFNHLNYDEVILATEMGVWSTTGINVPSPNWIPSISGLANVRVDMLQSRTNGNMVIAATHGRGMFSSRFTPSGSNILVAPVSIDFGPVELGDTAPPVDVQISNTGTEDLVVKSISGVAHPFSLQGVPALPVVIPPGLSITIQAQLSPTALGVANDTIVIESGDPDSATENVTLTGSGVPSGSCPGAAIFATRADGTAGEAIQTFDGNTLYVDIGVKENPNSIGAFGLQVDVDPSRLSFLSATALDLTDGFSAVGASENSPGTITIGGFGSTPVPVSSTGALVRLSFFVSCTDGETIDIVLSDLKDDVAGYTSCEGVVECKTVSSTGDVPSVVRLWQNYPNPFNPSTSIAFELPKSSTAIDTKLSVFDGAGKLVQHLVDDVRAGGKYTVQWHGRDEQGRKVPSGVYFYKLSRGDYTETKKMILMK